MVGGLGSRVVCSEVCVVHGGWGGGVVLGGRAWVEEREDWLLLVGGIRGVLVLILCVGMCCLWVVWLCV